MVILFHYNLIFQYVKDDGLIIAVSTAYIPFHNQPFMPNVELSCLFPCSPFPTVQIPMPGYKLEQQREPYHQYQLSFNKVCSGSEIKTDYFTNPRYSYISAVLISNIPHVFFPDIFNYEIGAWKKYPNDFMLVHNPLAAKPLPYGLLPVVKEAIANVTENHVKIKIREIG